MSRFNDPERKIEAIREEFHDLNDLEIQPGYRVNDLVSREECHRATTIVKGEVDAIVKQIEFARLQHARGKAQLDTEWLMRAQNAVRWKRRVLTAIHAKRQCLPKAERPFDFKQIILDVIQEDIGERRMDEYVAIARIRAEAVNKSNSGENS